MKAIDKFKTHTKTARISAFGLPIYRIHIGDFRYELDENLNCVYKMSMPNKELQDVLSPAKALKEINCK
jgi:hypothetical protein